VLDLPFPLQGGGDGVAEGREGVASADVQLQGNGPDAALTDGLDQRAAPAALRWYVTMLWTPRAASARAVP
jgi:hypothetical protein